MYGEVGEGSGVKGVGGGEGGVSDGIQTPERLFDGVGDGGVGAEPGK